MRVTVEGGQELTAKVQNGIWYLAAPVLMEKDVQVIRGLDERGSVLFSGR